MTRKQSEGSQQVHLDMQVDQSGVHTFLSNSVYDYTGLRAANQISSLTIIGLYPSVCVPLWPDFVLHTAWVCKQQDTVNGVGYMAGGRRCAGLLPVAPLFLLKVFQTDLLSENTKKKDSWLFLWGLFGQIHFIFPVFQRNMHFSNHFSLATPKCNIFKAWLHIVHNDVKIWIKI